MDATENNSRSTVLASTTSLVSIASSRLSAPLVATVSLLRIAGQCHRLIDEFDRVSFAIQYSCKSVSETPFS